MIIYYALLCYITIYFALQLYFTLCSITQDPVETQHQKTFIGKIPIMLRSTYCLLNGMTDRDLHEVNVTPVTTVTTVTPNNTIISAKRMSPGSRWLLHHQRLREGAESDVVVASSLVVAGPTDSSHFFIYRLSTRVV